MFLVGIVRQIEPNLELSELSSKVNGSIRFSINCGLIYCFWICLGLSFFSENSRFVPFQ